MRLTDEILITRIGLLERQLPTPAYGTDWSLPLCSCIALHGKHVAALL